MISFIHRFLIGFSFDTLQCEANNTKNTNHEKRVSWYSETASDKFIGAYFVYTTSRTVQSQCLLEELISEKTAINIKYM